MLQSVKVGLYVLYALKGYIKTFSHKYSWQYISKSVLRSLFMDDIHGYFVIHTFWLPPSIRPLSMVYLTALLVAETVSIKW